MTNSIFTSHRARTQAPTFRLCRQKFSIFVSKVFLILIGLLIVYTTPSGFAVDIKGDLVLPDEWTVFILPGSLDVTQEPLPSVLNSIPSELMVANMELTARKVTVIDGRLDLAPLFGNVQVRNTAYVFIPLDSSQRQQVTLGLGADWWFKSWLNGEAFMDTIETGNVTWPPQITNYTKDALLEKGLNVLTIKFISGSGSSILTVGAPAELRKVPPDRWLGIGASLNDRAYFAHPRVEYSKEGIENLAEAVIVLGPEVPLYVETAAEELAEYLGTACGKKIEIVRETEDSTQDSQGKIYVGSTRFSAENGIDTAAMDSEQWLIRTVDGNLILTGGDPRGTLYAVYHFLEKVVGIRWWSPWEEHIPQRENLASGVLEISGMPAFKFRCLNTYNLWVTPSGKEKVWAPRNRLNNEMHSSIPFEYGGGYENGPPSFVHTEGHYYGQMKRDGTLKVAWCAEKDGERTLSHPLNQLCLSNHEMRAEFLKLLRANIAKSHKGQSPATIFDVSFNDTSTRCECENCNALVKKYGDADSGLMLEFINDMADAIKDEYPDVIISTLAYMNTEVVPEGIVPHDNVMIVLCNTVGNYLTPISSDSHFANVLEKWSKVTKRIKIWGYHTCFADRCLPMPFESTFQPDLQLFKRFNVFGAMTELHGPVFEDMRDLRFWLLAKLMEDPWQSLNALIMDFTEGFYGPAGKSIRQYLVKLDTAAKANPSRFGTKTTLESCKFITPEFVLECQELFEQAERLVSDSPEFLRRVRHARLGVDKCAYILYPKIKEKTSADRNNVAERMKNTIDAQFQLRGTHVFSYGKTRMEKSRDRFLSMFDSEIVWDNCDDLQRQTWAQDAWSPRWFKKEEVGTMSLSTEYKFSGEGSIRWTVTKQELTDKLAIMPGLKFVRVNYLHGSDFARNIGIKLHVKCETPKHPPIFVTMAFSDFPELMILERDEVTDGWKEIVWEFNEHAGRSCTHTYFRIYTPVEEFLDNDVLDIFIDNMKLMR